MEWSKENTDEIFYLQSLEKSPESFTKVLSGLSDLLARRSVGDQRELETCKQELYSSGVLEYCCAALRFSPAQIEGSYASLTRMADIVSTCCVGIGLVRDEVFHHRFLPSVVENVLCLAHRLVRRATGERKMKMIRLFKKVFDSLMWILRAYSYLIPCVLQSKHYENVQMSEDDEIWAVTLTMWYSLLRANSTLVSEVGLKPLTGVTDDIVYKMSSSSNPVIGGTAIKTLLLILEQHRPSLQLLRKHYKGLEDLVWKDWRGKGFDPALEQLIDQLQSEAPENVLQQHSSEERVQAACVIQAVWRAHRTRCRIKNLPRAVSALQRSFRERRQRQQQDTEKRHVEEELRVNVQLRRQRAIRHFHQRQLHLMEILPADQVARYLGELETRAAVLIQRVWRGHRARLGFQRCRYQLRQHKAAVTLQRAVLRFLQRRRSQRIILAPWKDPRGLTDVRRTELRRQIEEHVSLYPSSVVSPEGALELHEKAQSMLQQHLMTRASDQAQEQHRQALLAQINTDLELLLSKQDSISYQYLTANAVLRTTLTLPL
ncbi:IQ calmodulin-binding motif-containing protein 1 isoform X2 [Brachyhypopomus gauderio]|uniref:IQ calmodulin-binding motif-containing protein 1 isoform X2 n=1 Tax=Brachyhypopomus gauderio TaxID=698409 RepID=UPI0040426686